MSEQTAQQSDRMPLGQLLLGAQLISQRQLDEALAVQRSTSAFLGDTLVSLDHVKAKDVGPILARELRVEYVNPRDSEVTDEVMDVVPESFSRQHAVMPLRAENGRLYVAMRDPLNLSVLDDLKLIAGMPVVAALSMERELVAAINTHFDSRRHAEQAIQDIDAEKAASGETSEELSTEELWTLAADAPVVRLVNSIIHGAFNLGVSDIHLEPQREQMRVRYRLDGLLYDHMTIPKHHQPAVVSRVKIMSRMNIAERRLPQDGRIPLEHHGKEYDLRVSTMPSIFGEKVVMRVLDKTSMRMSFEQLGFLPEQQDAFQWLIARPYGMILVTGPTGSGKSTT
ncbi:MAG TPA: ATPase, T2SS/T4P/T4SS family, partial [Anaerolineae bacterium]|nr:ATPase, T2SS/T4P/T4SS family [Anaerolineae bacterium]